MYAGDAFKMKSFRNSIFIIISSQCNPQTRKNIVPMYSVRRNNEEKKRGGNPEMSSLKFWTHTFCVERDRGRGELHPLQIQHFGIKHDDVSVCTPTRLFEPVSFMGSVLCLESLWIISLMRRGRPSSRTLQY
jgi:hypothetical protein